MSLKIKIIHEEDVPVIKIEGDLTYAEKDKYFPLQTEILKQARIGNYKIILDLTKTKFLDSKGLGCLMEISEIVKMHRGKIGIVTDNVVFRRIFRFKNFSKFLEVFDSVAEATFFLTELSNQF